MVDRNVLLVTICNCSFDEYTNAPFVIKLLLLYPAAPRQLVPIYESFGDITVFLTSTCCSGG